MHIYEEVKKNPSKSGDLYRGIYICIEEIITNKSIQQVFFNVLKP